MGSSQVWRRQISVDQILQTQALRDRELLHVINYHRFLLYSIIIVYIKNKNTLDLPISY